MMPVLLQLMVGMILLVGAGVSQAAVLRDVDYEARNYYNGDFDDPGLTSLFTTDDVTDDDDVTAGALNS